MTRILIIFIILFTAAAVAQEPERKSLQVTIYNQDLGVVKDVREIQLQKGVHELEFRDVAEKIDPTSVNIKIGADVLEQNYQYDLVDMGKILRKYIDNEVTLTKEGRQITGTLLSIKNKNIVLRLENGTLFMLPDFDDYQISVGELPEGLITRPTLIWTLNSPSSKNDNVQVSYMTKGISWEAKYVAVLNEDDTEMDLNSWVSIDNKSGAAYENADLKLIAGDVNLLDERGRYDGHLYYKTAAAQERQPQFEEKEFFEYHIYDLQRKTTIANNEIKQISLFDTEEVSVDKKYEYAANEGNEKVNVIVEFKNSEENNLGMPFPEGKARVYKSDGESIEFIGEDWIDHTPRNEEISLKIGDAFDILGETKQLSQRKLTDYIHEGEFEVTITNRKREKITVDVNFSRWGNLEIIKADKEYEKKDLNTAIFKVPAEADSKSKLTFSVRWGL